MNRQEAETIHEEVDAMKSAEALIEAIDEHRRNHTTAVEPLEEVLRAALAEDLPGDLFDAIEAIAMTALDSIREAAATTARQAAASAGIHDYQLPPTSHGGDGFCSGEGEAAAA